jgi:hypothetical protein
MKRLPSTILLIALFLAFLTTPTLASEYTVRKDEFGEIVPAEGLRRRSQGLEELRKISEALRTWPSPRDRSREEVADDPGHGTLKEETPEVEQEAPFEITRLDKVFLDYVLTNYVRKL